jgi:hypothetical protein
MKREIQVLSFGLTYHTEDFNRRLPRPVRRRCARGAGLRTARCAFVSLISFVGARQQDAHRPAREPATDRRKGLRVRESAVDGCGPDTNRAWMEAEVRTAAPPPLMRGAGRGRQEGPRGGFGPFLVEFGASPRLGWRARCTFLLAPPGGPSRRRAR